MANPLTVIPWPVVQYFDNNGKPLAGGLLYTYTSGSGFATPATTYSTSGGVANANPIVLDSAGRATIFLAATSYGFVLTDANGVQLWSIDGVPSTGLAQSIVGIGATAYNFGGSEFSPITNTSYQAGVTIDNCLANSAFLDIDSALLVGTFGLRAMIEGVSGITTTLAIVNLSDGSPSTPIQTVSSASATGALVTSTAIPFAPAGTVKRYAIKPIVSSGIGFGWNVSLTRLT